MNKYKISQVASLCELSPKQIRDYEKMALLPSPKRDASGYRYYDDNDLTRLRFISNSRKLGFPLGQIKQLLDLKDSPSLQSRDVKSLTQEHIQALETRIEQLQTMLQQLKSWHSDCRGDDSPLCPILSGLSCCAKPITQ